MSVLESAQALAFVLLVVFLSYILVILVPFLRRKPDPEGDPDSFSWHVFIPCRDEEVVIGETPGIAPQAIPAGPRMGCR